MAGDGEAMGGLGVMNMQHEVQQPVQWLVMIVQRFRPSICIMSMNHRMKVQSLLGYV